jgi:hypothetical protein
MAASGGSGEALVMLHWAMRSLLHWHTAMTSEIARDGGVFICHRRLF